MSRYAKPPKSDAKRIATLAAAVAVLSGCGSVSSTLGMVSGAADLVKIGAAFDYATSGSDMDVEGMQDAMEVLIIADEIGNAADQGAAVAGAVEPLIDHLSEE